MCLGPAGRSPGSPGWALAPQLLERVQSERIARKVEWAEVELSRQPLVQMRKLRLEHR